MFSFTRLRFREALALCALSCATWLGVGGAGCTNGTTPDCSSPDSGCGPGFDGPPAESSMPPDAGSEETPEAAPDAKPDAKPDAPSMDVASESMDVGVPDGGFACHHLSGMTTTLICTFEMSSVPCTATQKAGSCPSKGLTGCCVTTTDAGAEMAICHYPMDVPDAAVEMTLCTSSGGTWQKTAP